MPLIAINSRAKSGRVKPISRDFIIERNELPKGKHSLTRSSWKVVLFILFLLFLIGWSFWGDNLERKIYGEQPNIGKIGAEIIFSYSNGVIANSSQPSSNVGVNTSNSGVSSHLVIGQVMQNSPAERSGLKTGDIIVGLDGKLISSPDMAAQILSSKNIGDTLIITVLRNNQKKDIHLHLTTVNPRDQALKSKSKSSGIHFLAMLLFLKFTVVLFIFIYRNIEIRMHAVLVCACFVVAAGSFLGVYYPVDAFFSIKFNTIALLLGMYIISTTLDQAGFFDYVAYRIHLFAGNDRLKILIVFCIITYIFSLLVNNLTTIMVMIPMTLNLAARTGFDPRPIVIGEIISSNIGGASTMIGDFPNMLIASEAGVGFNQFIIFMMPICMILFGIMLFYLRYRLDYFNNIDKKLKEKDRKKDIDNGYDDEFADECADIDDINENSSRNILIHGLHSHTNRLTMPKLTLKEKRTIKRALFILVHMLILFSLSDILSLNPSAIALAGGLSVFLFSGMNKNALLNQISFNDVLFFTGLFIIVGGLETSGLLQYVTQFITKISMGKPWLCCLILMWIAAFFTAFLSAGPTTALFFPVVAGIGIMPADHIMWWSLSLGVLAGSSATLTGATAGPVATTLVENFNIKYRVDIGQRIRFTFHQFAGIGIPMAIIFLTVSSFYIFWLNMP
ncbi:MAG: PDZ domain-containing protein [Desulfamplus sp.]|nr:PDZ domain-containing protein [Desulfamplus sp.]